jgi:nicotinate-nucleotide--dimethylbenzimidazole phosphoribosyltransferase
VAQLNLPSVPPLDLRAAGEARRRVDQLTKPPGSLGRIEELAVRLCAIRGGLPTGGYPRRTIIVAAGDHGVVADGVSAYPAEVTAQMVHGFLAGHAAINAFARAVGAVVYVADFGVQAECGAGPFFIDAKVARGTRNLAHEAALIGDAEVVRVLERGCDVLHEVVRRAPCDVVALGEMGIGNTTSASAIIAALTGRPVREVTGRGTGLDDAGLARKIAVIERALERCADRRWLTVARELGGYEIVGLAGMIVAAAALRLPVVLDGVVVAAAALLAAAIAPESIGYCIAAHRSREPGHAVALAHLGLEPLLDLDLRLGEASGAALALPLLEAAARMISEMLTFAEAGVAQAGAAQAAEGLPSER